MHSQTRLKIQCFLRCCDDLAANRNRVGLLSLALHVSRTTGFQMRPRSEFDENMTGHHRREQDKAGNHTVSASAAVIAAAAAAAAANVAQAFDAAMLQLQLLRLTLPLLQLVLRIRMINPRWWHLRPVGPHARIRQKPQSPR